MTRCSTVLVTILTLAVAAPSPAFAAPAAKSRPAKPVKLSKRARLIAEALAEARDQRSAVVAEARDLARGDDPRRGAVRLAEAAVELDDPALTVEAAAAYYELRTRESSLAALPDAEADTSVDVHTVRVSRGEVDGLLARCTVIDEDATALHQQILGRERMEQRGRKEIRTGAILTSVGVAGLGVFIGGLAVHADRQHKLDAVRGEEQRYDLSSLDAQGGRATGMIAAGAVTGAVGLIVGSVLLAAGSRNLRASKGGGRHARIQVAPTTAGLLVFGRF